MPHAPETLAPSPPVPAGGPGRRRRGPGDAKAQSHDHDHDHDHEHGCGSSHGDGRDRSCADAHGPDNRNPLDAHVEDPGRGAPREAPRPVAHGGCCGPRACCAPAVSDAPGRPALAASAGTLLLRIPGMDCAVEEGQIRGALERLPAVARLRFDLPARALAVDAPPSAWDDVVAAVRRLGYAPERLSAPPAAADVARARRGEQARLVAALAIAAAAEAMHLLSPDALPWRLAGMAAAAVAIALSGLGVFRKGLAALARGRLGIDALMAVAVVGAFLIGQWPEAAMVMALYSLAERIEARSVERARDAIAGLLALAPPRAEVRQPDGRWAAVDAAAVPVGAVARVRPGERFALDGRVTAGRGAVDQSPVTGESVPVDKAPGDTVFAGTVNQSGSLEFEVTAPAGDTVLARIIHAVEEARNQRAPTQRLVDRFAAVYTPAVFAVALAAAVGFPLLAGWAWTDAAYRALVLLVIACPCALVVSTPVTVVSGLAAAARRGILVKGGVHLEQARRLRALGLDKTGTLTRGRPELAAHAVLADDLPAARVLAIAGALASRSDHPVSRAVASAASGELPEAEDFRAEPGRGVQGTVEGRGYVLGNRRWIEERGQSTDALARLLETHEAQGRTLSVLADGERALAVFAVADAVRDESRRAVEDLKALGVLPVMLTGDNATTAAAIARAVGIDEVRAGLLPADKRQAVEELRRRGLVVGMVGDGVNDSPALAAADIGFSLGAAGTDTAKEAADVLVMDDDLRKVAETVRLSRRTHAVLWQNIALALGIKAVFFGLALAGSATMWMAVFADMGASLLVVFNGLRLLRGARGAGGA